MHVHRVLIFRNSCDLRQIGTTGNVSLVAKTWHDRNSHACSGTRRRPAGAIWQR